MNWLPAIFRQRTLEQELDRELRFHFEQQVADNVAAGMTPAEARRQAAIEFGGLEQIKEACRDERRGQWLESTLQDFQYACRQLRKTPAFTLTVVISLALGIGANTALFSLVKTLVLEPLPRETANGLVDIIHGPTEWVERWRPDVQRRRSVAPADFFDWKAQSRSFEDMTWLDNDADARSKTSILRGDNERDAVAATRVFANFFPLLRVAPVLGRGFRVEDDALTSEPVALLSHGLWQRRFGGDPNVIGKTVGVLKMGTSSETVCTIVGVLPQEMPMFDKVELWLSQPTKNRKLTERPWGQHSLVLARLKPGVTVAQAQQEMEFIAGRIYRAHPGLYKGDRGWSVTVTPVLEVITDKPQRHLWLVSAIAGCVLLIACANVANLLLVRGAQRRREIAVRAVLGAGRGRLIRQLLAESAMIALLGGILGVAMAAAYLAIFNAFAPADLYATSYRRDLPVQTIGLDFPALVFALGLATCTGLFFGVVPALRSSRTNLNCALKDGGQGSGHAAGRQRLASALIVLQMTLAIVLVASAALLGNSLVRLQTEPLGYQPRHLLKLDIGLAPQTRFLEDTKKKEMRNLIGLWQPKPQHRAFVETFIQRLESIPGVHGVAVMNEDYYRTPIFIDNGGAAPPFGPEWESVWGRRLSPGARGVLGVPLLRGRDFSDHDSIGTKPVAIVDETFVRRYLPNLDPIGRHFIDTFGQRREIVGVVADSLFTAGTASLAYRPEQRLPQMFWPLLQPPLLQNEGLRLSFFVRIGAGAQPTLAAFREALREVDPEQTISELASVEINNRRKHGMSRFYTFVFGCFAGLGLLISAIGVYGVTAYSVSQRTHEIGVRMALGAQRVDVVGLVLKRGLTSTLIGVALGLAGALAATRLLSSLLYGVKPHDPFTFSFVAALLIAVALLACLLPARRATKVDPIIALRCE